MTLPVVHRDAHILQREAGDETILEDVADAFLDRRNELVGDRPALHPVDELEALAARQRFYAQVDFAKLSGATRLLLVTVVTLGLGRDRLAERDRRRMRIQLDPILRRHLVEYRPEVHL